VAGYLPEPGDRPSGVQAAVTVPGLCLLRLHEECSGLTSAPHMCLYVIPIGTGNCGLHLAVPDCLLGNERDRMPSWPWLGLVECCFRSRGDGLRRVSFTEVSFLADRCVWSRSSSTRTAHCETRYSPQHSSQMAVHNLLKRRVYTICSKGKLCDVHTNWRCEFKSLGRLYQVRFQVLTTTNMKMTHLGM
jgi:hypothetical protein